MKFCAVVGLGGSRFTASVGTAEDLHAVGRRRTPQDTGGIVVTEGVLDRARAACDRARKAPPGVIVAGIGSILPVDLADGAVANPASLPNSIDRIPLTGFLSAVIDSEKVYLPNDHPAGAIGERFVAANHPDDRVYLTISTGIGAGIAIDWHVLAGWDGHAGEVGHFTVAPEERMRWGCGRRGHREAYASGGVIPRYTRFLADRIDVSTGLQLEDETLSAAKVFGVYGEDPLATAADDRVGRWNALGLANIVHAYAPLVVTVGESVALHHEAAVLEPMQEAFEELVLTHAPEVCLTALGDDAVVRGAVASAMTGGAGDRARIAE